jgi:peroxiredoxin
VFATGDEFPNLRLDGLDGRVELRERWRRGPLVVMFMRHFGCAFCREHLIRMGRAAAEFDAAGAEVIAVFQYSAEATRDFCASRKVPFECLGDPLREAYGEVSLGRAKRKQVLSLKIARRHLTATATATAAAAIAPDRRQLG